MNVHDNDSCLLVVGLHFLQVADALVIAARENAELARVHTLPPGPGTSAFSDEMECWASTNLDNMVAVASAIADEADEDEDSDLDDDVPESDRFTLQLELARQILRSCEVGSR